MDDASTFVPFDVPSLFPDGVELSDATRFLESRGGHTDPHIKLRRATLDVLLDAASTIGRTDHPSGTTLWADEGAHRALTLLQLMLLKGQPIGTRLSADRQVRDEHRFALRLAALYRATCMFDRCAINRPGDALAGVAGALIALFAPVASPVTLNVSMHLLTLDYWRARALISIGSELVVSSLRSSLQNSRGGHIAITLDQTVPHTARLIIEDNIASVDSKIAGAGYRLIGRLSRILNADLQYRSQKTDGYRLELSFETDLWTKSLPASSDLGTVFSRGVDDSGEHRSGWV